LKPGDVNTDKFILITLKTDSTKSTNVAAGQPEILQRLQKKHEEWIKEVGEQ